MNPSEKIGQNGTVETNACPVCNTPNELNNIHCTTCAWYFPLKGTPQFALELSRAKQQFQMVQSFNQVYQHMQIQSKVLEKMSFRLDGLEGEMKKVKEGNLASLSSNHEEAIINYPALKPIISVLDLKKPVERKKWWVNLEEQWQKAFNAAFFQKGEILDCPSDEELLDLFQATTFRSVGPRGMYPNLTFELTNLSGLIQLTSLEHLFVTHGALTSTEGVAHLKQLKSLFLNSNKLTDIKAVHYIKQLKSLYINANQLTSILPLQEVDNLEILYCNYNQLQNFSGITSKHEENLKEFFCLPNDKVTTEIIKKFEDHTGIKCLKG